MGREIDEAWIEEAIERYRRMESLQASSTRRSRRVEVTVRSPDGLVEVVVTADGTIRDVTFARSAARPQPARPLRSVRPAVTAAADAAAWARTKLHARDLFGGLPAAAGRRGTGDDPEPDRCRRRARRAAGAVAAARIDLAAAERPDAFGGDATGRLGELGGRCTHAGPTAVAARAREAAAAAPRSTTPPAPCCAPPAGTATRRTRARRASGRGLMDALDRLDRWPGRCSAG